MRNKYKMGRHGEKHAAQLEIGRAVVARVCELIHLNPASRSRKDLRSRDLLIRILRELGLSTTAIGVCVHRDHSAIIYSLIRTQHLSQTDPEKTFVPPTDGRYTRGPVETFHSP